MTILGTHTEEGVMVMKDGKGFGIVYEDGRSTEYGWMNPSKAPIYDPKYYKHPTEVVWKDHYKQPELRQAKMVAVKRTIVVESA